ncbi:MAG TPA: hypothetical protein VNS46_02160 [Nocardioides sp.]|nr:hypothetical protein [Nocardioides sp.]
MTFAVQAAADDPIVLCANVKTAAVSVPADDGECGEGTRSLSPASEDALAALRQTNQQQEAAIAALQADVAILAPGSTTAASR